MNEKVHIIESPNQDDLKAGRHESTALSAALNLFNIANQPYIVKSKAEFLECLMDKVGDDILGLKPHVLGHFLHFSCHGNKNEIGFTNGDFLTWKELAHALKSLNDKIDYVPLPVPQSVIYISVSVCEGLNMIKTIDHVDETIFNLLVGPSEKINWSDGLLAFVAYFHTSIIQKRAFVACKNMNTILNKEDVYQLRFHPNAEPYFKNPPKKID